MAESLAVAVDLSAHLSEKARSREKQAAFGEWRPGTTSPDLINLDGGVPSPSTFPFETLSAQILKPDAFPIDPSSRPPTKGFVSWLASLFGSSSANEKANALTDIRVERYAANPDKEFEIASAMTYSPPKGLPPLQQFVRNFVANVHRPAYSDWDTLIDLGAGDALPKVLDVLTNPADGVLVDEWCYNSSLVQIRSVGLQTIPVQIDAGGLDPVYLNELLEQWKDEERGCKRPNVLLQVPVGQNPTGTTLSSARKRAIYDVCVKWDIVIIEDDPYHFMQSGQYVRPEERVKVYAREVTDEDWKRSLVPSFVRHDYQGRVIRLDTFSKVIGPGGRLGFFTASKFMLHHLLNAQKGTSTAPSGLSQSMMGSMLLNWGEDGFVRWLRGIRGVYRMRRDWVLDLLFDNFDVDEEMHDGHPVFAARLRTETGTGTSEKTCGLGEKVGERGAVVRFVPPVGGMFLWFEIDLSSHPSFRPLAQRTSLSTARTVLSERLSSDLVHANVLMRPGALFQASSDEERDRRSPALVYLRMSFASVEYPQLKTAMETFAKVLGAFFGPI